MAKSDVTIHRQSNTTPGVALTANAATTTAIRTDMHEFVGFIITAHATAASFVIHVSADGTNFFALNNSSDAAVGHNLSASKAYALPAECKPWPWVKIVLNGGTATVTVTRKS